MPRLFAEHLPIIDWLNSFVKLFASGILRIVEKSGFASTLQPRDSNFIVKLGKLGKVCGAARANHVGVGARAQLQTSGCLCGDGAVDG
jgi:hypothetical protein